MNVEYHGLSEIKGSFVVLEGVSAAAGEAVTFTLREGGTKQGQVAAIDGGRALIQVFEGTEEFSLTNTSAKFSGRPMQLRLSAEIPGRIFDGAGRPIDGLPRVYAEKLGDINGAPLNPVARTYPGDFIQTGISAIDGLATLIRGQKLPIFTGSGLPNDRLAAQIVSQASLGEGGHDNFVIVFACLGVKHDVADFYRRTFEEAGALGRVVMFLNLAHDPVMERIITPKVALCASEYLAFEKDMHVLTILTDMTAYAEALREISSAKGEIPGRKGYPGYLYSELASVYERAGIVKGSKGSLTQIPILTMPGDDITHPIPDLTGYITEGQIVLDRGLHQRNIYPPISVLPSLSRLMKDGIGEGHTREDHRYLAQQLLSSYSKVSEVRALASVIGEDELSETDKMYIRLGRVFEEKFLSQGPGENRQIAKTLNLGWEVLRELPEKELDRAGEAYFKKYYRGVSYGY